MYYVCIFNKLMNEIRLTFQRDDFARWIHYRRVRGDGSSDRICGIVHVDDNYLGRVAHLFSYAYEFVRLHGESVEADIAGVDSHSCELHRQYGFVR